MVRVATSKQGANTAEVPAGRSSSTRKRARSSETEQAASTSPTIPLRGQTEAAHSKHTALTDQLSSPTKRKRGGLPQQGAPENVTEVDSPLMSTPGSRRSKPPIKYVQDTSPEQSEHSEEEKSKKRPAATNRDKSQSLLNEREKDAVDEEEEKKKKKTTPLPKKRKTKAEKEAEAMPLAARTTGLRMFVGAHVSMAKGLENAVTNTMHIGGNAFALFLKSQRKWDNPDLKAENRDAFIKACSDHKYDASSHVLPHGSYLVNLAQVEKDKADQAYRTFVDDLHRCEALGIKYYNFHPGAAGQSNRADAIRRIADQLNQALAETKAVVPLLENMAGSGSIIGSSFSDLRDVIAQIKPEFKSRIGVCIDTCHSFAAGYDLRTPSSFQGVLQDFDKVVGLQYLKAWHLNDSKAPFNSNRDLHQNIGLGFLGLRAFHSVMNEPRLQNMPLILETPCDKPDPADPKGKKVIEDKSIWAREIKLLESLIGMDSDGPDFKKLEKELSDKGKPERVKMQKQFDEKNEKAKKKIHKDLEKGQKGLMDMMGKKEKKGKKSPVLSDEEEASE